MPARYALCMRLRPLGQYCGVARALETVGERWALLIVRDLLVRPRRYTDLREGLAGIPTNVLSSRLRELESAGVVERQLMPAPERAVVYALTASGRSLEQVVLELGRWGAARLGDVRAGEIVTAESLVMALRTTFRPDASVDVSATWEIDAGDVVVHAHVSDAELDADVGPSDGKPDLTITTEAHRPAALKELMSGELTPDAAVAEGHVGLTGRSALLETFATVFRI
jgi:DNA-binding HxlR family transcriptional regulator